MKSRITVVLSEENYALVKDAADRSGVLTPNAWIAMQAVQAAREAMADTFRVQHAADALVAKQQAAADARAAKAAEKAAADLHKKFVGIVEMLNRLAQKAATDGTGTVIGDAWWQGHIDTLEPQHPGFAAWFAANVTNAPKNGS